jgi:predicted CXXCH cytochrome family protein
MSKKIAIITLLTVVFLLLLAGSTYAATGWVHGNYSASTDGCAGCHVAHAATLPKLLKSGATQTHFCYLCHGSGGPGAPYDAEMGQIMLGTPVNSTAGGFEKTGGSSGTVITSRHKVWGYATNAALNEDPLDTASRTTIPGGTGTLTTGLACGSCHDPHAGGPLTLAAADVNGNQDMTGGRNPRLLRKSLLGTSGLDVTFQVYNRGNWAGDPGNTEMVIYEVTGYISGSSAWCSGCHNKFNKIATSGRVLTNGDSMYRHAMNVAADLETTLDGRNYANLKTAGTPLEAADATTSGAGNVACLTCHRAHSTTATAAGWAATWTSEGGLGTGAGSALLRMDNRGVCWSCHDAATANLP